jgi:2-amino-4-hydroxy-6-hydroxymethyldihydropteridine diphosphokinase
MISVYIGLGTNLGDRYGNLSAAKKYLLDEGVIVERESSVLETEPVDLLDQPSFLNQIILVVTDLPPEPLLDLLISIEEKMGRVRIVDKGPRIIDLDILLYGNERIHTERLSVPHYAIRKRDFILRHLVELEPSLSDPVDGVRYADLLI